MAVIIGRGGLYVIKKSQVQIQNALAMESGEFLTTETGEYIVWG
jgi:hypothetical protein